MKSQDYLRVLRERWMLIISCVLLAIIAAGVASVLMRPTYQASTGLFVTVPTDPWQPVRPEEKYQGGLFAQQRAITYTELVTSVDVLQRTIDDLQLGMTTDELARNVRARLAPDSVLITVEATEGTADGAADLANQLAAELITTIRGIDGGDGAGRSTDLVVAQRAVPPDFPVSPQKRLNLAAGLGAGLLLGMGAAVIRDRRDKRVKSIHDIEPVTGDLVVVQVPRRSRDAQDDVVSLLGGADDATMEPYRELRTALMFREGGPARSVVVASPSAVDDRGCVAAGLAGVFGRSGSSVALVDADLRNRVLSNEIGVENEDGLSEVLLGLESLDWSLTRLSQSGVSVLASGATPQNPSELLVSGTADTVLNTLREQFDQTIVSTAPVLSCTDAVVLSKQVDGLLLVVRGYATTRDEVVEAVGRLTAVNAVLVGVVMLPRRRRLRLRSPNRQSNRHGMSSRRAHSDGKADSTAIPANERAQ